MGKRQKLDRHLAGGPVITMLPQGLEQIGGISVRNLINRCYEARLDLNEDDEEFIERLWKRGISELRQNDLSRLKRCSKQLGELEGYM